MMLSVKQLKKHFSSTIAVNDLSFEICSGDIIGFVGPNGAGKTTTLRILATLDEPTDGDVEIDGHSIIENPEFGRGLIGFVPDSLPVHSDMNVHEYLDFFARAYGIKKDKRIALIEDLEEFTNLLDKREKLLSALSKGMKQRVSIARSLINDPKFILMDEPAAGLDPRARIELRELLLILARRGKGILISSHILSELSEICTSALIIEKGELLRFGRIEEVTRHDGHIRKLVVRPIDRLEELSKFLILYPGVENLVINGKLLELDFLDDDVEAANMLNQVIQKGFNIIEFRFKQQNLESVFMNITKGDVQ